MHSDPRAAASRAWRAALAPAIQPGSTSFDIICLLDCDPWGHYIFSVIKRGSISIGF